MRTWSFHALLLASGAADEETASKRELLARLGTDGRHRAVKRAQLEELIREEEARKREELQQDQEEPGEHVVTVVTATMLAMAFQQLLARDKQEFMETEQQVLDAPARVYWLSDYPASLAEVEALLRLGEVGGEVQMQNGPEVLPLLPLIDGVVLIADPANASLAKGRMRSNSNAQRKSISRVSEPRVSYAAPGLADVSVFQSCNTVVKTLFDAAQVGGFEWSDFTFTHVNCSSDASVAKTPDELERELFDTIEASAAHKLAFKNWVGSTTFCVIPDVDRKLDGSLLKEYESVLDGVFPSSIAVSTVLFAITEAVAVTSALALNPSLSKLPRRTNPDPQVDILPLEEFIEYGDVVTCRLASAQLCYEALQLDNTSRHLLRGKHRIDDVERAMWRRSDLPGVGNEGRKAMPRVPEISEPERRVRNTELATFYNSPRHSMWMVHLTRQLIQVEDLLGRPWKGKLQQRQFLERLSRAILPQRIAAVLQQNMPDVYLSYYAPTDSLLLACLPKTAPGRMQSSLWTARDQVRHRPAFKDWKSEQLADPEYLTPRTEAAAQACVPLSSGQLSLVSKETWSMYPADHSVVRLYRTPRGFLWLTVYYRGEIFGLRSDVSNLDDDKEDIEDDEQDTEPESSFLSGHYNPMHFVGSFQDDSTIHVSQGKRSLPKKPDGFPSTTVSNSFPSGLIVSACSDGSIVQRSSCKPDYVAASSSSSAHFEEKYRVVFGKGSVLRVVKCGRKEVMLASGIIRIINDCGARQHHSKKRVNMGSDLHPPLATTLTLDPETNALVERRPDGVIIVTLTSGARVTYHVDGTRMYTSSANSHVLVKKQGFADVCVDVDINVTAQHHAAGERVAVMKGGLRTRSIVNVYDGTCIEISYNTKVTAQVNGRVTTRKPGGQIIVAKDSGRIEYYALSALNASASKDDDDRNITSYNGVYYFDYQHGRFELCDNEQNQFRVALHELSEGVPNISVDLAGVVSDAEASRYDVDSIPAKAVINEPIQPHVFILNGDGTGVEMLRPEDVSTCIDDDTLDNQTRELANTKGASRCHAILRQMAPPRGVLSPLFGDLKLSEEMQLLQRPVATAGKFLSNYFAESGSVSTQRQFTTVRRIEQIDPLSADELDEMQLGWSKWQQWQKDREANKECYNVVDPRQPETIAQELAMQKKVLAAYKATRARKKLARQKAREMKAKDATQERSPGLRMETVQEGEEPLGGEGDDDQDSDDEFGQFGSDLSDDDVGDTVDVDDPMELLWSAFSQADREGRGLLSVAQTRLGVVNVLGIGVSTSEITEALVELKIPYPFNVSFDVFADLVACFRKGDEDNQDAGNFTAGGSHPVLALKAVHPEHRKELGTPRSTTVAAGSAAEAVRVRGKQT